MQNEPSSLRPAEAVDHLGRPMSPVALAPMGGAADDPQILNPLVSIVMNCFAQTSSSNRQNSPQGGARSWSAQMSKAEQFREYAEEAMRWSHQSKTEDAKNILIDLALTWTQAASLSERQSVGLLRA